MNMGWSAGLMFAASILGAGFCFVVWACAYWHPENREKRSIRRRRRKRVTMLRALRSTSQRIAYRDVAGIHR